MQRVTIDEVRTAYSGFGVNQLFPIVGRMLEATDGFTRPGKICLNDDESLALWEIGYGREMQVPGELVMLLIAGILYSDEKYPGQRFRKERGMGLKEILGNGHWLSLESLK